MLEKNNLFNHNTVFDSDFQVRTEDRAFEYQKNLTRKLDNHTANFNQEILNEIVLWKVNRYATFEEETINLINSIIPKETKINIDKTKKVLTSLLNTKGVQLAMASTILRFKNPNVYQIIDQRVYRIIYPSKTLKVKSYKNNKIIKEQIELYLRYLNDLKNVCLKLNIPFKDADRILFMADKRINRNIKLNNY